jgi:hypothetical protein
MDSKTEEKLLKIKNEIFKINVLDIEAKLIVRSVYFKKNNKNQLLLKSDENKENINNRQMKTMVWEYYKSRNKTNVNDIINKYGRDNLIINYSNF